MGAGSQEQTRLSVRATYSFCGAESGIREGDGSGVAVVALAKDGDLTDVDHIGIPVKDLSTMIRELQRVAVLNGIDLEGEAGHA